MHDKTNAVVGIIPGKPGIRVLKTGRSKIQLRIVNVAKKKQINTDISAKRGRNTRTRLVGKVGLLRLPSSGLIFLEQKATLDILQPFKMKRSDPALKFE